MTRRPSLCNLRMDLINPREPLSPPHQLHLRTHHTNLQPRNLLPRNLRPIRKRDSPMQILPQIRQDILLLQASQIALLVDIDEGLCERDGAGDEDVGFGVLDALGAVGRGGVFAEDVEVSDERVLGVPGCGIGVEFAEEDVHAVGLVEDVFRGFDVDDVFGVFACLRRGGDY
jgi:hypothetical protein